ncbi:XRE family transcriptional regulator [Cryobacterium sp. TMT2-15-1]|uniref:helix-turn-helix domain-containing protein n=1 Tax=Cryobacterium sp. TMT2-15-1 TaxID=1259246 RepID=UPI00106DCB36|nr:helix-turn-helix transcriptional regulator [Cryobacterium sp. TMT2-15-1]TFC54102.1 XRE family transcriptional regulator [Cryobacterium sp. TMT2-15-1]
MSRNFKDLADRAKAGWSEDTRAVYEAAGTTFDAEIASSVELGAMLAAARKARELTQPALSSATGIQQAEISRIERGLGNPTAATLSRLAAALGQKITLTRVP